MELSQANEKIKWLYFLELSCRLVKCQVSPLQFAMEVPHNRGDIWLVEISITCCRMIASFVIEIFLMQGYESLRLFGSALFNAIVNLARLS